MAGDVAIVSGMAGRYANALFELAVEAKTVDKILGELEAIAAMLESSADLQRLVRSPVFGADEQSRAIAALMDKAGIGGLTANFMALLTRNRRLFAVRDIIKSFRQLVANHRGETTAEVVSATPLTAEQTKSLQAALKSTAGKSVRIDARVDETLLGGLIVKVGSRMIDTSLRTKLNNLKIAMKEVG